MRTVYMRFMAISLKRGSVAVMQRGEGVEVEDMILRKSQGDVPQSAEYPNQQNDFPIKPIIFKEYFLIDEE